MSLMKDRLADAEIALIARVLKDITADFDAEGFRQKALAPLADLELKQRVDHVIECMGHYLPDDFEKAATILAQVPARWPQAIAEDTVSFSEFAGWPVIDYVAAFGLDQPDIAIPLLGELTCLFSAEFAIRPFILNHWGKTLEWLHIWQASDSHHKRRLVSEGTRPRLPWGIRLPVFVDDPAPVLALLSTMVDDPNEVVRRSVANNLNDISKDHPDQVVAYLAPLMADASKARERLVRHALRTLIKAGDTGALAILGVKADPDVAVALIRAESHIRLGESLNFAFRIDSMGNEAQQLVVDFKIHFMKANGKTAGKVFKLKNLTLSEGDSVTLEKSHAIKPITTRKYYSGEHRLELMVNGQSHLQHVFELVV